MSFLIIIILQAFVEGFHVRYRVAPDLESAGGGGGSTGGGGGEYKLATVLSSSATMYVLTGLQKYTYYEIRVRPFYRAVSGTESNLFRVRTLPDS